LDRVSRDQADVATLFKHLRFAGVQIVTLAEGEISELHVGLKGTMNALFLKDLAAKTHRGLRGRVEKGKAGGGLCYGYEVVKRTDSEGAPVRGERTINEAEAAIVRRFFREFAVGKSPRAIATDLNRDGIPGPFGHTWGDTTIRGHACRGNGVVNNELYARVLVWNRQRFIKDPNTGKRVSRPNPEAKWIRTEVPELRIVDDGLWQRVKLRQAELAKQFEATTIGVRAARAERLNRLRRPAFLLSGLLTCGCCGGKYGIVVNDRYGCLGHFRKGLLGVHSRCGLHTRAVTSLRHANRRLQPLRYLHDCSDCFRLERLPGGACTHWKAPPLRGAHPKRTSVARGLMIRTGRRRLTFKSEAPRRELTDGAHSMNGAYPDRGSQEVFAIKIA
jgi:site-specific DNA recombinase